jgi:hypothetical protein
MDRERLHPCIEHPSKGIVKLPLILKGKNLDVIIKQYQVTVGFLTRAEAPSRQQLEARPEYSPDVSAHPGIQLKRDMPEAP